MTKMLKKIISSIPNAITSLNLIAGCVAIIFAFHHNEMFGSLTGLQWCYISIAAAAVFDFCDGASARALGAYSLIGKELDSLSDLVSFGVAPAMMMLNLMLDYSEHAWLCYIALFIPVCGALRLAKFNIDDTQATCFKGLPIPANALFWIGMSAWIKTYVYPGTAIMAIIIVLMSLAMVSNLKMFTLKFKTLDYRDSINFRRYVIILAAILFVIMSGIAGLAWTIILYLLISFFTRNREA
jgi:CDP-diacylglycerol--serine O-phosphatidyltransferase